MLIIAELGQVRRACKVYVLSSFCLGCASPIFIPVCTTQSVTRELFGNLSPVANAVTTEYYCVHVSIKVLSLRNLLFTTSQPL
jgi:hypothetical protein